VQHFWVESRWKDGTPSVNSGSSRAVCVGEEVARVLAEGVCTLYFFPSSPSPFFSLHCTPFHVLMSFMVYPSMEPRSCKVLGICIPRRSSTEVSSPQTSSSHNRALSSLATFGASGKLIGLHAGTFTRTTKYMAVHDILPRNLM